VPFILARQELVLNGPRYLAFSYGPPDEWPTLASVERDLGMTIASWRAWCKSCALPTLAPAEVLRSALCLKLHIHHDTGAIIAAATTSIPEALDTPRTWDYRYCWLRDAVFVVDALRRLGQLNEGEAFMSFLLAIAAPGQLQPVYAIDGTRELGEELLPHLSGFGGTGPVRIGNAAYHQTQNDLAGEIILSLQAFLTDPRLVDRRPDDLFPMIARLVEHAITAAPQPDMGIWEFRSALRHHTFSRAMCWAAIDRGARLARLLGQNELARRWEAAAAVHREIVLDRGYNREKGFFTQTLDGEDADASNLLLGAIGIVPPRDPRFVSTVEAYGRLLVDRGLVYRYKNLDDFGETTTAFTMCCFWWIEALALIGRVDEAVREFERVCQFKNAIGLFSEDIDPATGALLGNYPQAYTHVGHINTAVTISEILDARRGPLHAWF
jgi:GH15 family glucan-1,4-alpha-glucosidase